MYTGRYRSLEDWRVPTCLALSIAIEDFVDKVYNSIREFGYNLKTTPIVFVGGGAVVMKNFGSHDAKNISYNLDVKANARGYEQLAMMGLKSARRLS